MIDSDYPICVRFWEYNANTANANALIGSAIVADLLCLTENAKNSARTQQQPSILGAHRATTTFRIAYSVFIRHIGIVYSDEDTETTVKTGEDGFKINGEKDLN